MKHMFILVRKTIYFLLFKVDSMLGRKNMLFVLNYHSFSDDNWYYSVKINEFKKQIKYLKDSGYKFITTVNVADHINGKIDLPSPSVAITFDDGYLDNFELRDILKKEEIFPTVFLISDKKRINRKALESNKVFLGKNELKILKNEGWIFGSHSSTHSELLKFENKQLIKEISGSKNELEDDLDQEIKYFAYPFGSFNETAVDVVRKSGYELGFSMQDGEINSDTNLFKVPRIGVNNSHSINEFKTIYSPSVVLFRSIVKKVIN